MASSGEIFHRYRPGPPLSAHVDFVWSSEGYRPPRARERLLPNGSMELVFTLDADGRARSGVAGARSEFVLLETPGPICAIGVRFKPGGGVPFFPVPADELSDRGVPLDLLWAGGRAAAVGDRLWEAATPERRFRVIEAALLGEARGPLGGHPAVRHALDFFDQSNGTRPVSA